MRNPAYYTHTGPESGEQRRSSQATRGGEKSGTPGQLRGGMHLCGAAKRERMAVEGMGWDGIGPGLAGLWEMNGCRRLQTVKVGW